MAIPETRLCTDHARAIARYGGEFVRSATRTSRGKDGSLKKNYGDVSVESRRNADTLRRLIEDYDRGRAS